MKKVMIGILVVIPVIILVLVAAVSRIVSTTAYIAVEDVKISIINSDDKALELELNDKVYNANDYLEVTVLPERATYRNQFEWHIEEINYKDAEYENRYNEYLENYADYLENRQEGEEYTGEIVNPAAMLVDDNGHKIEQSSTGKFMVNAYCSFYLKVTAESFSDRVFVNIKGLDIQKINIQGPKNIAVGENVLLSAIYNPVDSIVNDAQWSVVDGDENVKIDANGVVTGIKKGEATIKVRAKKFTASGNDDKFYVDNTFNISVKSSVSKYGKTFTTDLNVLTKDELGIENIDLGQSSNIEVEGNLITITSEKATIVTDKGVLKINRVDKNAIKIENANIYNFNDTLDDNFVKEVGELDLKLNAVWAVDNREGKPNVIWSVENEYGGDVSSIAKINQDGYLKALKSGYIVVKATSGEFSASIKLNIQQKLTSIRLDKTNETLSVGLARETVFANQKFASSDSLDVVANFVEFGFDYPVMPTKDDNETELEFINRKNNFLKNYKFEIISGGDKAHFENNRLVFDDDIKGKVSIKVKISAKYPKYVSLQTYTTEIVNINVVSGIVCNNLADCKKVGEIQKSNYEFNNGDEADKKVIPAVCLNSNVKFPNNGDNSVNGNNNLQLYGSIFGNNYTISCELHEVSGTTPMVLVRGNNAIISNVILRANHVQEEIKSASDSKGLTGYVLRYEADNSNFNRLTGLKLEYSVLENAKTLVGFNNVDADLEGCIFRNTSETGLYAKATFHYDYKNHKLTPYYSHLKMNNCIMSNLIATGMSLHYSNYTKTKSQWESDWKSFENAQAKEGNTYPIWTYEDYMAQRQEFLDNDFNTVLDQDGFLDIYNWRDIHDAELIDTRNEEMNQALKMIIAQVLDTAPNIQEYKYLTDTGYYMHLGFISPGMVEESFVKVEFEDKRFCKIDTSKVEHDLMKNFSRCYLFGYHGTEKTLTPSSKYTVNKKLIDKLHGIGVK